MFFFSRRKVSKNIIHLRGKNTLILRTYSRLNYLNILQFRFHSNDHWNKRKSEPDTTHKSRYFNYLKLLQKLLFV